MTSRHSASGRLRTWLPAILAGLLLAGPGFADELDNVLVMRAADLETQNRCTEAVEVYRGSASPSAHLSLIAGRCQVRMRDYTGALATLGPARELPEASAEVDLYHGIALYHLGSLDEARVSLDRAKARGQEGALIELYSGLLQLQADDVRGAAMALERARRADSRAVEPVASYYAWLAWRSADDEERAAAALARVRAEDPDGPWVAEAEKVLAGERSEAPTFWLNAEAGLEYDSNVTIRGSGVSSVVINGDVVSDKEDGRGIWTFDGGSELFRTDDWSGGVLGAYTGTAHFDVNEFDAHYPTAGVWLDRYLGPKTTLRGRYDFGYAWINYDPYLMSNILTATLFQFWDEAGATELSFSTGFYDFDYDRELPPSGSFSQIDQDSTAIGAELLHRLPVDLEDLELRFGYRYTHNIAEGREFDYDAHRFLVGFDVTLPFEVAWDAFGAFTYQPYRRPSVYAELPATDAKHRDRAWEFGTELEKFVSENVSLLTRYRFVDTGSNTNVYDYDRHVVGGYVRIRFR